MRNFRIGRWLNFSPDFDHAKYEKRWQDRIMPGHITIGPVTLYGANAMHWTLEVSTPWGFLCAHPTTHTFGGKWPWKVFLSPDATPMSRRWGFGPGLAGYGRRVVDECEATN